MIPEAAVQAAAGKLFQSTMDEPWEAADPEQEAHFRKRARGMLEAPAPHLLAGAKDHQVVPEGAVIKSQCLECDWRYYALSASRAAEWADAHSQEDGHAVRVAAVEGGNRG